MTAVTAQQAVINDQRQQLAKQATLLKVQGEQIALIARLAGVTDEVDALAKTADIANPAQPIPDPAPQAPSETTEQAATPETNDDPRAPGQTGNSTAGVPAAATDTALTPGATIPTPPYNNLADVTAPVSGHLDEAHTPPESLRIETDVRVGDPMQPEVAFPWTISENQSNSAPPKDGEMSQTGGGSAPSPSRTHACLRLARLQVQAGLAKGDDLTVAASLEANTNLSDTMINYEIGVLERVKTASRATTPTGSARVASRGTERVAPSLASQVTASAASAAPAGSEQELTDLFVD
jgi:hypothetical protein